MGDGGNGKWEMELKGMGWDQKGWDGMGSEGMGWDGMEGYTWVLVCGLHVEKSFGSLVYALRASKRCKNRGGSERASMGDGKERDVAAI